MGVSGHPAGHRDQAKGRGKEVGGTRGEAVEFDEMCRSNQDDALNDIALRDELRVAGGRDGAGVGRARVRNDERFRRGAARWRHTRHQAGDEFGEGYRVAGIEPSCHCRRPDVPGLSHTQDKPTPRGSRL